MTRRSWIRFDRGTGVNLHRPHVVHHVVGVPLHRHPKAQTPLAARGRAHAHPHPPRQQPRLAQPPAAQNGVHELGAHLIVDLGDGHRVHQQPQRASQAALFFVRHTGGRRRRQSLPLRIEPDLPLLFTAFLSERFEFLSSDAPRTVLLFVHACEGVCLMETRALGQALQLPAKKH